MPLRSSQEMTEVMRVYRDVEDALLSIKAAARRGRCHGRGNTGTEFYRMNRIY